MPTFLLAYHGGTMPESPADAAAEMARWEAWFRDLGDAVVHDGAPLGPARLLTPAGVGPDDASPPLTGYTILAAADLDAAVELARGCPGLDGGASIRIAPELSM